MWFPEATKNPIAVNYTVGGMVSYERVIIHIMAGTYSGTDSWFRNPQARASAHFGTSRTGAMQQWVDTKDRAWHAASANPTSIGIENEGVAGDSLTALQIHACAEVLARAHVAHGVPLRIATTPTETGLAWHGLGKVLWGNHPSCPGSKIVIQLPEILRIATKLVDELRKDTALNIDQTYNAVWEQDKALAPSKSATASTNKTWKPISFLRELYNLGIDIRGDIKALRTEVAELKRSIDNG